MNYIYRNSLLYGTITALVCFAFYWGMTFVNPNPLGSRRPDVGFNLLFIGLAMWQLKRQQQGVLHFYQAFSVGFLTNLWAAFLTGFFLYVSILMDPVHFQAWLKEGQALLLAQRETFDRILNEETFQAQLQSLANAKPYQVWLDELMFKQVAVVGMTLIGMILRKKGVD